MIEKLLTSITPSLCLSCGQQGSILCEVCKFNIIDDGFGSCLLCGEVSDEICAPCRKPWLAGGRAVGWRDEVLEKLGDTAKFERSREAARTLAALLNDTLPNFPEGTIITSVPTHPAHVRQRGYDFVHYMAQRVAQSQSLPYHTLVERRLNTEQRGHGAQQRALQASNTYAVRFKVVQAPLIILIDDVVTTGSTLRAVAQKLYTSYETPVYLAAAMRQPKNNTG